MVGEQPGRDSFTTEGLESPAQQRADTGGMVHRPSPTDWVQCERMRKIVFDFLRKESAV
jgi:hypothetical protein